jgi:O-antigen/teichoic acid export membrane protein
LTSIAVWPVLSAVFFVLPWAVPAVLGPDWTPAVPVAQVLCVAAAVQVAQGFIRPAMLSVGAVGPYFVLTVVVFVASLATYLALAGYGAFGVALGYASVAAAAAPALGVLGARALHLPVPRTLGSLFAGVPYALAVAVPVGLLGLAVPDVPRRAVAQTVVAAAVLVGTLAAAYRFGSLAPRAGDGAARDDEPLVACREPEPIAAQGPTLREQS